MIDVTSKEIDKKWQAEWSKRKLFEPKINESQKKFFITVPIPYPSGSMHLGHMYTWTRADIYARFMRMKGYNVLFPQGFHFTGGPIIGISEKVKQKDEKTLLAFKQQGVSDADLKLFAKDPRLLAEYFTESFKSDFKAIGMSIDWTRTFITSYLNEHYSRFIEWQFNTLRKKGLISEGRHPVVWCTKEDTPLGDHDRAEGEGESPQKFTIIKFKCGELIFPAATLRPETVFGVTNVWVNESAKYVILTMPKNEQWVVSSDSVKKLENQISGAVYAQNIEIKDFIGKTVKNPVDGTDLPILPLDFVDANIGTGVVMSVPMHAPFDFYGIEISGRNAGLKPKKIIEVGAEDLIREAIDKYGKTKDGLKAATKYVYKKEFNYGVMNKNAGPLAGMAVKAVGEAISKFLEEKNAYAEMYELTGKVVCRCGAQGIVKVLDKQWFIRYSDKEWKAKTRRLVKNMKTYPEEVGLQLLNTIEWLDDKAAARRGGLGTTLPWDKDWIIEPLSDSTIYMAYYTIANTISALKPSELTDSALDYIFLGKGAPENLKLEELRKGFLYWYPLDMRVSAKELLQNHFIFFLFNHAAIFGEDNWPRAIGINGWLTVSGEKLSKSKGATLTIKKGLESYSADQLRFIAAAGNGMDDVEWDPESITGFNQRINFIEQIINRIPDMSKKSALLDTYLLSRINGLVSKSADDIENFRYESAVSSSLFELTNEIKLYLVSCLDFLIACPEACRCFLKRALSR